MFNSKYTLEVSGLVKVKHGLGTLMKQILRPHLHFATVHSRGIFMLFWSSTLQTEKRHILMSKTFSGWEWKVYSQCEKLHQWLHCILESDFNPCIDMKWLNVPACLRTETEWIYFLLKWFYLCALCCFR